VALTPHRSVKSMSGKRRSLTADRVRRLIINSSVSEP
jgi:hypothetical protein